MSRILSIQFSKQMWTKREIRYWLADHNFYPDKPILTYPNYYRVRLINPRDCTYIRNKKLPQHGIIFTFCFP